MITLRNKTVSQTFLPSFDNPNGRLCQERLFWSRNFATMVTWRHTSSLLLRLTLARIKTLGILLDEDWERDCFNTSSVRASEPASFWRENATDIVVLVLRCSENDAEEETSQSSNVKSCIILRSGEGSTSFNKMTLLTFLVEKRTKWSLRECLFFENTRPCSLSHSRI